MEKIISLFQRNYDGDLLVRNEVTPGAEWVIAGEGRPTTKLDGTCCLVRDGVLFKRYEVKKGGNPPPNFEPACEIDPVTGKQQGWLPVGDGPEDKWHREARENYPNVADGTYELIGEKIQGGIEKVGGHHLIRHGLISDEVSGAPRNFKGLKDFFESGNGRYVEGIVWHHPDGRMVKIKAKDFGFKRQPKTTN